MNQFGQITASTLNLRQFPNTSSAVIDSFLTGTMVEIVEALIGSNYDTFPGTSNQWYKVKLDGKEGFMAAHFIVITQPSNGSSRVLNAIFKVNADHVYYKARDITSDGIKETFCNWFVADVLDQLNIEVPRYDSSAGSYPEPHPVYKFDTPFKPYSAESLFKFFDQQSNSSNGKWKQVSPDTANQLSAQKSAVSLAIEDKVVLASFPGLPGRQGHIAIVRPDSSVSNLRIAQAGSISSNNLSLADGFGSALTKTKFFTFVG
jgi:hypothetical protein